MESKTEQKALAPSGFFTWGGATRIIFTSALLH